MTDRTTTAAALWSKLRDEAAEHVRSLVLVPGVDNAHLVVDGLASCPRCGGGGAERTVVDMDCRRCGGIGCVAELYMPDYGTMRHDEDRAAGVTLLAWAGTEDEHVDRLLLLAESVRDSPVSVSNLAELTDRVNYDAREPYSDTLLRESIAYHAAVLAVEQACEGLDARVLEAVRVPAGLPLWAESALHAKAADYALGGLSVRVRKIADPATRAGKALEDLYEACMEEAR